MNPILSIDDNQLTFTIVAISDDDDPGKLGLTFVRLDRIQTWFAFDQLTDQIEELDEQAAMPLELLWLAYKSGKASATAQHPGTFTQAVGSQVSHLQSSPGIARAGHKVHAYAAAHASARAQAAMAAAQGSSGASAGPAMGGGGQGGVAGIALGAGGGPGAGSIMVAMGGGGSGGAPTQQSQAEQIMQMLRAMPHQVAPEALGIPPVEEPVQDEQESINQLDRELAGLDEFLNDVRGHTGGDL